MALLDVSQCTKEQLSKVLEIASDVRKFEIDKFWQRSLFFWGFITTALVGYSASSAYPRFQILAADFGFVCALSWTLQNRGSKYWYEAWEQKVKVVEERVLGCALFSNIEPAKGSGWLAARRYSPTKSLLVLSDFTVIIWFFLLIPPLEIGSKYLDFVKIIELSLLLGASIVLLIKARPEDR